MQVTMSEVKSRMHGVKALVTVWWWRRREEKEEPVQCAARARYKPSAWSGGEISRQGPLPVE